MKYFTLESSIFSLAFFVLFFISNVTKGAIFYSIQDGNWEDQAVWSYSPNGNQADRIPSDKDDVIISHQITQSVSSGYTFYGKVEITSEGFFTVFSGSGKSDPYIYAGDEFLIEGTFESSSDFHHQEEGSLGDGLLYIGPSAIINVGDDLILNGYGQTLMDNASCGNGSAVDDIYFVGEQARICGNGRFIVPDDIRFWLDNGQELTNESAINEQVATQMCRGFTLYGSSEDCSAGTPRITGNADFTFPVEWVDFSAVQKGGRTELSWTTGAELNNDYFVIEKSIENQDFVEIGRVEGVGNSTESNTYKFSDLQLAENVVYYRIKQVDIDGAFSYSEVLSLRLKASSFTFGVFPNPSQGDVINIEMSRVDPSSEVEISLMDMQGRAMYTENRTALSSLTLQLNLPRLNPGLYHLKVKHGGNSGIKRLVIK